MNFQRYTDALLAKTLLPFIPNAISPNMVSFARILSLPFICYFLLSERYAAGLALFALAALTDALDGAMARTRDRITETGKVLDAVADRGLIALVALFFIPHYLGWWLVAVLALLELGNGIAAYASRRRLGINPGANWAGKVKMLLQSVAFMALFVAMLSDAEGWRTVAYYLLLASLLFATIQIFSYPKTRAGAERA